MFAPYAKTLGKWSLAVLPLVFLSACATTESVSEQTAPLGEKIAALDTSVEAGLRNAMATANEAKFLAARQDARLNDLESRFNSQSQQLVAIRDDIARLGTENANTLALLRNDLQARQQADTQALKQALSQELGQQLSQQLDKQLDNKLAQAETRIIAGTNTHTDTRIQENNAALSGRMDQLEKRLAEVARMAEDALAALGMGPLKIYGKVVHSVTLTDDKTLFPINSPDLGDKDIAKLKDVADYVKKLDVNYHLGIHGHTDGLGSDDYNYELGKARAEVVKAYLHEKLGIPLLRMSVISHGAVDVSSYREGANRRIVVDVLQ
jgi:outer membrane protein OmpA-like peptidoglycan-associated protein